jgi:ubiquinone/menaquinone biosynthesis C-methylase UbiE
MSSMHSEESSYVIDPESTAEMARLLDQDVLISKHMGGLFPPDFNLASVQRVLDIGCGPGGWVLEVAFAHPDRQVVGIDISQAMISYGQAQAMTQGLTNATFRQMDATGPLDFPDASFDFVNGRFLVGFMWKQTWPQLLQECWRILRPSGTLRITETDFPATGITNSAAVDRWTMLACRAFYRTGRSFSGHEESGNFGITPMLRFFFEQGGFVDIRQQAYLLDYSVGTDAYAANVHNMRVAFKLGMPFLARAGLASMEELEKLYDQTMQDISRDDFRGVWYFMSVWGRKPAGS